MRIPLLLAVAAGFGLVMLSALVRADTWAAGTFTAISYGERGFPRQAMPLPPTMR